VISAELVFIGHANILSVEVLYGGLLTYRPWLSRQVLWVHPITVETCMVRRPNCKKNRFRREQSAKMYPASEWRVVSGRMMMIRACLALLIPTVMKDLVSTQVFRHAV
jgi:hypothetical protein